ncbi:MAG: aldehyde ferredoxin oxidoreductase C-terminal domain-containing protein, partial [Chloroflexota bacterium]
NLKAVAVRGRQPPPVASPERVKALRQWVLDNMANKKLLASFHDYGTGAAMAGFEKSGNLPVRNFRDGLFPQVTQTDARTLRDTMGVGMDGCFACPVRCKKRVSSPEPYPVDAAYGGPEYETLAVLGANCGVDNLKAIARGNQLCGANGLDTISTGSVIAWAMECFERGLLTTRDTGGLKLEFGNGESMLALIELIARREGIGDRLAEGTARAARQLGPEALALTVQVKGLDAGMHDPRFKPGLGLGYMVNPHGADHCCNLHDTDYVIEGQVAELKPLGILEPLPREDIGPAKVALFKAIQAKYAVLDCLVVCRFLSYSFQQIAEIIGAVTGWDTSPAEQQRVAERVLTVARLFNLREGFTAADDELPPRFYQPKTDGALADKALDPEKMRQARRYYYTLMGWDADTGVPTPEKRAELGLG